MPAASAVAAMASARKMRGLGNGEASAGGVAADGEGCGLAPVAAGGDVAVTTGVDPPVVAEAV